MKLQKHRTRKYNTTCISNGKKTNAKLILKRGAQDLLDKDQNDSVQKNRATSLRYARLSNLLEQEEAYFQAITVIEKEDRRAYDKVIS